MASISVQNDTSDVLNVFLVGPDLSIAQYYNLHPGSTITFQCQAFLDYALGAFSASTGALLYVGKARADMDTISLRQMQVAAHAQTAQRAAATGSAKAVGQKGRRAATNPTVHPDIQITLNPTIDVVNGRGSATYSGLPTSGNITGTFTINSPPGGTWTITATDENGAVIFPIPNAVQGVTYPFSYQPSNTTGTVTISVIWSTGGTDTLQATVTVDWQP